MTKKLGAVKTTAKPAGKNWLMAVDPFAGFDWHPVEKLLQPLAARAGAKLRAIYVLAPVSLNWTGPFSDRWLKQYGPVAEAKLTEVIGADHIEWEIVPSPDLSLRSAVKTLLYRARKMKSECVVISAHSHTALERWTIGSFAETVILSSPIPVLVINPSFAIPESIKRILVPVDLDSGTTRFVMSMAKMAKAWGSEIVLYHKQSDPLDPIIQQGVYSLGGGWVSVQGFMEKEIERKTKQIAKLETAIERLGVRSRHVFDSSPTGLVASIDQAARENKADMIAVLTHSERWTASLLGSVARGLVRQSGFPIFIRR